MPPSASSTRGKEPLYWAVVVLGLLAGVGRCLEIKRIPVVDVTGVAGGGVELACDVTHPPGDHITLILWFRDGITTPIYRLDEREGREREWLNPEQVGSLGSLSVGSGSAVLLISPVTPEHRGLYTCRADFNLQPTKTTRVSLDIIVPPASVSVVEGGDLARRPLVPVSGQLGPYLEGDYIILTCVAHGGEPRPRVSWYLSSELLDEEMESEASLDPYETANQTTEAPIGLPLEPYNTLTLGPLARHHLLQPLSCRASNTNLTNPTSLTLTLDLNLPPLTVRIRPPSNQSLRAGGTYKVECAVTGARPPPSVTWWSGRQRVLQATVTTTEDGNLTVSRVVITPRRQDDGSFLRCIAETHAAPAKREDTWVLSVLYTPIASCSFGASLNVANIKEGDDVYFECTIQANPRASVVIWRRDSEVLEHNVSAGVIVSNQSLVLQKVMRAQAGRYSCHARNSIGLGSSNSLRLDVKYAPVCSPGQVTTYAVGRYEDAEVTCQVDANPRQESFQWTFNNTADTIDVPQGRFSSGLNHSVITYTPMTALDYGTLLCWATNEIGTQREPCVFHIVPAGKPDSPRNCTAMDGTRTSVRVVCVAGSSGGLTQHFILHATQRHATHTINLTALAVPDFIVSGLAAGGQYEVGIRAVNSKGSSEDTRLTLTSTSSNASVYRLHDGPFEAEVRDGGPNVTEGEGWWASSLLHTLVLPSFLLGLLGLCSGLLLLLILALLLYTRRRRRRSRLGEVQGAGSGSASPGCSHASTLLTPEQHTTCLDDLQQTHSESDSDPDVIPLQESHKGATGGDHEASPHTQQHPSTLLPPTHYRLPPQPTPTLPLSVGGDVGRGGTLQSTHLHFTTAPLVSPQSLTLPRHHPHPQPHHPHHHHLPDV